MSKEYQKNGKEQKKNFKKYRKSLMKVLIGVILAVIGYAIPASAILNVLGKIIVNSEWAVFLSILPKVLLMAGGGISAVVNGIKAHFTKEKIDELEDEEIEIVELLEKENSDYNEKINSLEKELTAVKDKNQVLSDELSSLKQLNKQKEKANVNDNEYIQEKKHTLKK